MNFLQIGTIDSSGGMIYHSDRGYATGSLFVLDNPVLKLDFTNAASSYVIITFTDALSEVVAEWTVDDTLKVNYVEIGDVLRYAVQPVALNNVDQFDSCGVSLTMTVVSYDSNNTSLKTTTLTYSAFRSSEYTSPYNEWYPTLPSKFRMLFDNTYYDYLTYNILAAYPRTNKTAYKTYDGLTQVASGTVQRHSSANYIAVTPITLVTFGTSYESAVVEQPACDSAVIALKWWSRIGGCWKSVVLDTLQSGYTNDETIDYWTDMVEDQLKGGTTYIIGRFHNATYKDFLYYSDILLGEHLTASVPTSSGFQDVPVKVSGSWSYKQNDIKDMDFTITIKQYDIDD